MRWMIEESSTSRDRESKVPTGEHPVGLPQSFVESLLDKFGDPTGQQLDAMKELFTLLKEHDEHVDQKMAEMQKHYDTQFQLLRNSVDEVAEFYKRLSRTFIILVTGVGLIASLWTIVEKAVK